ncbi:acetate kinase [Paraburkholderia ginsengiterrae]|uniref:Acetate kinase n=1 Tax=Paraburkholderia ginsengiterrae TaxID=1462993 RepID=A0A1A9MZW9_9BURK|nr:acetate/propionate family kinase [Paraburkholderia ginsengiterrae]OAJ53495.1 acetate kinase [Paraburkholderia ginsengiterrae]OAJ59047.1 acetate kinase [Paraburkholderia ginsengiterrae]
MPIRTILVLNAGSSSIKFALFSCPEGTAKNANVEPTCTPLHQGEVSGIGTKPVLRIDGGLLDAPPYSQRNPWRAALGAILEWVDAMRHDIVVVAVAHRVVHGGAHHMAPVVVDALVFDELCTLIPLAPLHQPHNIDAIDAMRHALPGIPQIAVFDTSFHQTLPRVEQLLPLPREWFDAGVRRYGFHGLSYEYLSIAIADRFGAPARGRVIAAHLGNGASLCAMLAGQSVASTMGFSALDGLMMGTRSGSLDPGVVLHMMEARGMSHRDMGRLLYEEAGLKGVSGYSSDVRDLLGHEASDERARDALALYVHRIVREAGALTALLGGLDMLVFTAGIGEHCAPIRTRVCAALRWLGVEIDEQANANNAHVISTASSWVTVVVEPTNEEWIAARSAWRLLDRSRTADPGSPRMLSSPA